MGLTVTLTKTTVVTTATMTTDDDDVMVVPDVECSMNNFVKDLNLPKSSAAELVDGVHVWSGDRRPPGPG